MASTVASLEAGLAAMASLKPPGASNTQIHTLNDLCVNNPKDESVIVQKLFTHFKKTPPTHKLGVLYLVEMVIRSWTQKSKELHQEIGSSAPDGTFAAGAHRIKELLPILVHDIVQSAPADQKEKVNKVLDIFDRNQYMPPKAIQGYKEKLREASTQNQSTTPPGSPPPNLLASMSLPIQGPGKGSLAGGAPAPSSTAIIQALASIAQQSNALPPISQAPPATGVSMGIYNPGSSSYHPPGAIGHTQHDTFRTGSQPATVPGGIPGMPLPYAPAPMPNPPPGVGTTSNMSMANSILSALSAQSASPAINPPPMPSSITAPYLGAGQPGVPAPGSAPPMSQDQLVGLVKTLIDSGTPVDKVAILVQAMTGAPAPPVPGAPAPYQASHQAPQPFPQQNPWIAGAPPPRDGSGGIGHARGGTPPQGYYDRPRSRSPPGRQWDSRGDRNGRDRNSSYGQHSPGRGRQDEYEDRAGRARQRSPFGRRDRSPIQSSGGGRDPREHKRVEYDRTMKPNHIKVYSRTLFVGGVTVSEAQLSHIFSRCGEVQSAIINKEKRHAFVKMLTRELAVKARHEMKEYRDDEMGVQLRTRWGVGFGPRDCCNYEEGVSVIPIHRLTEADRKWLLTAEYGGTGGLAIESGMCVEEPDIEIGAGVSSKAISRRMQTDKGGAHGPKSSRTEEQSAGNHRGDRNNRNRDGRREDRRDQRADPESGANPNVGAPGYPFPMPGMPGMPPMPMYPGFMMPPPDLNPAAGRGG